jgi:hypothetical protein
MTPAAAHHALGVLAQHTLTPRAEKPRIEVLRAFTVLTTLADMYRDALEGNHAAD